MFSEQFLTLIFKSPLARWFSHRLESAAEIDPKEGVYVENVRSVLGVPHLIAKAVCEAGVRDGTLKRRYSYYCPNDDNHRVIKTSDEPLADDTELVCEVCELKGNEPHVFRVQNLTRERLYGFQEIT